jgi:hypothetical protein
MPHKFLKLTEGSICPEGMQPSCHICKLCELRGCEPNTGTALKLQVNDEKARQLFPEIQACAQ